MRILGPVSGSRISAELLPVFIVVDAVHRLVKWLVGLIMAQTATLAVRCAGQVLLWDKRHRFNFNFF